MTKTRKIDADRLSDIEAEIAELELERLGIRDERKRMRLGARSEADKDAAEDFGNGRLDAIYQALSGAYGLQSERLLTLGGPEARQVKAEREKTERDRQARLANPRAHYAKRKRA